jgi:hypothetical protein
MPFTFKVGAKIKEAWVLYKEHFGAMVLVVVLSGILQSLSSYFSKQEHFSMAIVILVIVASILISYIWMKSIMNLLDGKGFKPFTNESIPNMSSFWDFIKTNILVTLCVAPLFGIAGLIILFTAVSFYFVPSIFPIILIIALVLIILLIIPGLYLMGRLFPAVYLSVEKCQGARKSIREAWGMTKGNAWKIIGKSILIGLFIFLGFIALIIGSLITYPIGMIVLVMLYREIAKSKTVSNLNPEMVSVPEVPRAEVKTEVKEEVRIEEKIEEAKEEGTKEEVK